jgi:hypothetical protein
MSGVTAPPWRSRVYLASGKVGNKSIASFQACTRHVRFTPAGSSGRCNTGIKSFGWGCKSQSLTRPFVELPSRFVELSLRVHGQVGPLRKVLPQKTVGVLIGATLPRTLRIAEVNLDIGRQRLPPMIRKLFAAVPGQRLVQLIRYRLRLLDQRGNNTLGILVGDLRQGQVTRLPFDQGRDVAVLRTGQ